PTRALFRRAAELKYRRVFAFEHFGAQFDFDRAAISGVGDEPPERRRADVERSEVFEVERRKKTVGIDPGADAFDENMPVHRYVWIQIGAEHTVVFGIHAAQVHANPRHAATT